MTIFSTTSKWSPIDESVVSGLPLTTDFCELPRSQWPPWAAQSTSFNRLGVFGLPVQSTISSTSPSTGIVAAWMTERIDPKDYPKLFNYNLYLIAQTTDGKYFQSPPIIPTDPTHHSSSPSTWFNAVGRIWTPPGLHAFRSSGVRIDCLRISGL